MAQEVIFHRLVQRDMNGIRRFYSEEASPEVADRFYEKFLRLVDKALNAPSLFHPVHGTIRRANIKGFPGVSLFTFSTGRLQAGFVSLFSGMTNVIPLSGCRGNDDGEQAMDDQPAAAVQLNVSVNVPPSTMIRNRSARSV